MQYSDAARRYQLLDTMREFGAERLAQASAQANPGPPLADAAELRARHRDYYRDLAAAGAEARVGADQTGWLARLGAEADNLRAALDFSFAAAGQQDQGLLLSVLLRPYWLMVGQFTEGRRWHDLAVAVNPGSPQNAWAVFGAGVLAVQQGDLDAGGPLLDRAAALAAASGDENLAAHVSDALGIVAFNGGDLETAQARYEAALASYERIGFGDPLALVTYSRLASACILSGALDRAVQLCEECLRRCDETGEQWARGTALWVRGATRWLSGDITGAIADSLSCLRIKESVNDLHTIAMSFDLLSVCRVATAEFELAAVLHGAGEALWTRLNAPVLMGPGYAEIRKGAADTARAALGGSGSMSCSAAAWRCTWRTRWRWPRARRPPTASSAASPAARPPSSSPGARRRSPPWSRPGSATARSPRGSSCPSAPWIRTWSTSSPSSASRRGRSWRAGCSVRASTGSRLFPGDDRSPPPGDYPSPPIFIKN